MAGGWCAYWLRWDKWTPPVEELLIFFLAGTLTAMVFPLVGAYRYWDESPGIAELGRSLLAFSIVLAILLLLSVMTKTTAEFSRLWMGYWLIITAFLLIGIRTALMIVTSTAIAKGWRVRSIAVVGDGDLAKHIAESITSAPLTGLRVAGFISDGTNEPPSGFKLLGSLDNIEAIAENRSLNEIWLALPLSEETRLKTVLESLRNCTLTVRYVPDVFAIRLFNHVPAKIGNIITIELNGTPLRGLNLFVKTLFDWLFALVVVLVSSPVMLTIALLIKSTSPGPVFFVQTRHGWDGRPIRVYKFRTMHHTASSHNQFVQATRGDTRITPIGRFLRRTSLDELPQFFNVLQGRLSVVGPRPHPIALNDHYKDKIDAYMQRHRVKPGITGWAQINGFRGETGSVEQMRKRIEFDLYYIENWTLWLDLKIVTLTALGRFTGSNAY